MSKSDFAQPTLFGDLPEVVNPEISKKPKKTEKKNTANTPELIVPHKAPGAFKTISEAAKILAIPQHVLRFWETKFRQIRPLKLKGGRRYYRPEDIDTLQTIKHLLYKEGYTINGARKAFDAARRRGVATESKAKTRKPSIKMPELINSGTAENQKEILKIRDELVALRKVLHTAKSKA